MPSTTTAARESRARRALQRDGRMLRKSRGRLWSINDQGGYRIIDPFMNTIIWGERFDLSLTDIERIAAEAS